MIFRLVNFPFVDSVCFIAGRSNVSYENLVRHDLLVEICLDKIVELKFVIHGVPQ